MTKFHLINFIEQCSHYLDSNNTIYKVHKLVAFLLCFSMYPHAFGGCQMTCWYHQFILINQESAGWPSQSSAIAVACLPKPLDYFPIPRDIHELKPLKFLPPCVEVIAAALVVIQIAYCSCFDEISCHQLYSLAHGLRSSLAAIVASISASLVLAKVPSQECWWAECCFCFTHPVSSSLFLSSLNGII